MSKLPLFLSTTEEENYLLKSELRSYKQSHGLMQNQIVQLESQLQAAKAKIKELEQAQEWISVDDRLPEINQECLILCEVGGNVEKGVYIGNGDWRSNWCNRRGANQTYKVYSWTPFSFPPPQPKVE